MKKHVKQAVKTLEKAIKSFNFCFFLISLIIWLYITISNILTQPFEIGLLWSAFNNMYGQLSFKVGCIVLIVANGIATIQSWFGQYYQLKEYHEHVTTIHKAIKGKK